MLANLMLAAVMLGGVPLDVEGDVVQVVRSAPFTVVAKTEGELYFWSVPAGFSVEEDGPRLTVKTCPTGEAVVRVRVVSVDWDARKMVQVTGETRLIVGMMPNPPPKPDDPDTPPTPNECDKSTQRAKDVCGWIALVPEGSRAKRAELAKVFAELADGLEGGKWLNYSESNAWFRERQAAVLSSQQLRDDWATFGGRVAQLMAELASEPRTEVVAAYRDIAEGLK